MPTHDFFRGNTFRPLKKLRSTCKMLLYTIKYNNKPIAKAYPLANLAQVYKLCLASYDQSLCIAAGEIDE